jgi:hypothetical protein
MKRSLTWTALAATAALMAPATYADVKTREKTTFSMEGVMGGLVRMFGGKAAKEGVTSTVAVKGDRKASISDVGGEIVDLTEERVYTLDTGKKEYRVKTFAEIRAEFEKAKAEAEKQAREAEPEQKEQMEEAGRQLEFDVNVSETGERKTIAGREARQVILTIAGREKGQTLESGGGFVLTNDMWIGPRVAALDELAQFQMKYFQAVYGSAFTAGDMQQMVGLIAMYPSFVKMAERLRTESGKLEGTPLATTTTFEGVKSEAQMKQASEQSSNSGGGGLGGMLARRMMRNRAEPQARSKVLTTTHEMLSIDTTVGDADVALPANYKLKD